jgi:hypothetical protein
VPGVGVSILHVAAAGGRHEVVRRLVAASPRSEQGALIVRAKDAAGNNAIIHACRAGRAQVLNDLLCTLHEAGPPAPYTPYTPPGVAKAELASLPDVGVSLEDALGFEMPIQEQLRAFLRDPVAYVAFQRATAVLKAAAPSPSPQPMAPPLPAGPPRGGFASPPFPMMAGGGAPWGGAPLAPAAIAAANMQRAMAQQAAFAQQMFAAMANFQQMQAQMQRTRTETMLGGRGGAPSASSSSSVPPAAAASASASASRPGGGSGAPAAAPKPAPVPAPAPAPAPGKGSADEGAWETTGAGGKKNKKGGKGVKEGAASTTAANAAAFLPSNVSKEAGAGKLAGRQLQRMELPDEGAAGGAGTTSGPLEDGKGGAARKWNQFTANESLFGVKATFDETAYTTALDKSAFTAEQIAAADVLAKEILEAESKNPHVAAERGKELGAAEQLNEEDMHSAVLPSKGGDGGAAAAAGDAFTDAGVKGKGKGKAK